MTGRSGCRACRRSPAGGRVGGRWNFREETIMEIGRRGCLIGMAALAASIPLRPAWGAEFKMGLLVTGSVAEEGWNRIAYDALKGVEKELSASIGYVE